MVKSYLRAQTVKRQEEVIQYKNVLFIFWFIFSKSFYLEKQITDEYDTNSQNNKRHNIISSNEK